MKYREPSHMRLHSICKVKENRKHRNRRRKAAKRNYQPNTAMRDGLEDIYCDLEEGWREAEN